MNIFDIHIKNGEIIDGTGAPKFKSDIVIDKGKIIESGTHDELIEKKSHYYQLYTNQSDINN